MIPKFRLLTAHVSIARDVPPAFFFFPTHLSFVVVRFPDMKRYPCKKTPAAGTCALQVRYACQGGDGWQGGQKPGEAFLRVHHPQVRLFQVKQQLFSGSFDFSYIAIIPMIHVIQHDVIRHGMIFMI